MKIAFILNNLSGGGAERVAVNVANDMSKMGHSVHLILNYKKGPYLNEVTKEIQMIELGKRMLFALPWLLCILRRERFDAVFTVLDQPSIATLIIKPFIGRTKIIVVECNNPLAANPGHNNYIWKTIRSFRSFFYPKADHIIAKSNGIKKILSSNFNCAIENISSIPNPVDIKKISFMSSQAISHKWLEKEEKSNIPVIIAMGRLVPQKGFDVLLRAFFELRKKRNVKLIILGDGKERSRLESICNELSINDDVDLLGFVDNPYAYIAKSDCFVLSSRWEGWPNALIESLACGTPVVSTDCETGPNEIINSNEIGFLVRVDDYMDLAEKLDTALKKCWDPDKMITRVSSFTPREVSNRYIYTITPGVFNEE